MSNARELAELSGSYGTGGFVGMKNRIINGAMMIDQRNAGASVTPTNGQFLVDRYVALLTQASKFSVQQKNGIDSGASNYESGAAPAGFRNSIKCTSLSAFSIGSGDVFCIEQRIEGYNVADLGFGAAGASSVTFSFWVKSSLTGTFGGALKNGVQNRAYPFSFVINAANTWEQKSVTIAGDTSGTWVTDNGNGLQVVFSLGAGSTLSASAGSWAGGDYYSATGATSVVGTNGATFYITGVQLEKGSTATSFDYRPYGTELALCQRYYQIATAGYNGSAISGTANGTMGQFIVPVRAVPTVTWVSNVAAINFPTTAASFYLSSTMQNFWPYKIANGTGQDSRYHDNYTISAEL